MSTLKQLIQLSQDYCIPPETITFNGEHDTVCLYGLEKYLPDPSIMVENENGEVPELEIMCEKYGISYDSGYDFWYFYT